MKETHRKVCFFLFFTKILLYYHNIKNAVSERYQKVCYIFIAYENVAKNVKMNLELSDFFHTFVLTKTTKI